MFEYEARFDEEGAREAERQFFVRSIRKLRSWTTVVPPPFLTVVTLVGYLWQGDTLFVRFFGILLVLSLLSPIFQYYARPAAAARLARRSPIRRVRMNAEGLSVEVEDSKSAIPWKHFKYVWKSENYLLLVINPYASVNLPKQGMPVGAEEFVMQRVGGADH